MISADYELDINYASSHPPCLVDPIMSTLIIITSTGVSWDDGKGVSRECGYYSKKPGTATDHTVQESKQVTKKSIKYRNLPNRLKRAQLFDWDSDMTIDRSTYLQRDNKEEKKSKSHI